MAEAALIKNKYRILHQVGKGGMGSVYAVVHEGLGTTYALKQLHLELADNAEIARRFTHEAQMMAQLQHPNIVRVFDIDSEPGFGTYLLMELIRGVDLGKWIRKEGRLKYQETLRIGAAIAAALETAHRAGLVHRDIKPGNILIEESTHRAVVTDFGIAKRIENVDGDESVTRTGGFIGTYRYCSPEQIRNEKDVRIDGRADVYSLGVVLYEMLSGKRFLDGMSEMQIANHVGFQPNWKPTLEFPEPPPAEFRQLLDRCLALDRNQRPTAAEIQERMQKFLVLEEERGSCLARKQQFEELGFAPEMTPATGVFAAAEALRNEGDLTEAISRYREAEAAYRQIIAEKEVAARCRQAIQRLRPEVIALASDLHHLQQELSAAHVEIAAPQQLGDLDEQLAALQGAEDAGQMQAALSGLESLKQRLAALRDLHTDALHTALQHAVTDLRNQWQAFRLRVGELTTADHASSIEQLARAAEAALAQSDWAACRTRSADGHAALQQIAATAHDQASTAVATQLDKIRALLGEVQAHGGEGHLPALPRFDEIAAAVQRCLDEGQLFDAVSRTNQALAVLHAARDQVLRTEQERAARARTQLEQLLAVIDADVACRVAPDQLNALNAAREQATAAEQRGDYRTAIQGFEQARLACQTLSTRVTEHLSKRLDVRDRELRALVDLAAEAPDVLVGDARRRGAALLAARRPADLGAALESREALHSELTALLNEAKLYVAAEAERSAAEAIQERVTALSPSRRDLRTAAGLMQEGTAAAAQRQWDLAQQRYRSAAAAFVELEREFAARQALERDQQRVAAARADLESVIGGLDFDGARAAAPDAVAQARAVQDRAAQAEQRGDYADAAALFDEAAVHFREVAKRVATHQTARIEEIEKELAALLERAAGAPPEIVAGPSAQARALHGPSRPGPLAAALAALENARDGLAAALDEAQLFEAATQRRTAVETRQQVVKGLGPSRRQLRPAERLLKGAVAAMNKRQWATARERYDEADAAFSTLELELRARPVTVARPDEPTVVPPSRSSARPFPPTMWVGTAATALVAVVIGLWALKIGPFSRSGSVERPIERSAERPAVEGRPAERPAVEARPVEQPVAPPIEQPVAPPVENAAAPPPPAPPLPPHIASFAPDADAVAVKEGARQSFSIAVDDKPAEGKVPVEWKLDGKVVASNVTRWDYQPDYAAATGSARHLDVLVGTGKDAGQSHAWNVNVEDVNRAPSVHPQQPSKVQAQAKEIDLKVTAADPDGDPLTYQWTIDGAPAGTNAPTLTVNASTDHAVALTVSDGKDKVTNNWQIAAVKPVQFSLDFSPKQLDINTEFNKPKTFELVLPARLTPNGLRYSWTLNDQKVSAARTFVLKDYSASMVGNTPLSIVATASNDQGQSFSHEWKVTVLPPAPEIAGTTPASRTLEAEAGRPLAFNLEARAPVGNQHLTYVYELDGKSSARGANSRFEFTPSDDAAHEIVGYVEDNYQRTSAQKIKWTVQSARAHAVPGESDITDRVRKWLKDYEQAWNSKDVAKLAALRGMNANMASQLEGTLKDQKDLRVKFSDFNIEKVGTNQVRARYHRLDEWIGLDGKERSIPRDVEQTFQLDGSLLRETHAAN